MREKPHPAIIKRAAVAHFLGPPSTSDGSIHANGAAYLQNERLFDLLTKFFDLTTPLGTTH